MPDSKWSEDLTALGYASQQKFDFYAVVLCFTLLGLAVESASFGSNAAADLFELVGWIALLVAGVAGFDRLERQPQFFQLMGYKTNLENGLTEYRAMRIKGTKVAHDLASGENLELASVIAGRESAVARIESRIREIEGKTSIAYRTRSYGFLIGLSAVMVSRGLEPFLDLIHRF